MKTPFAALFVLATSAAAFAQLDNSTILVPINPGVVAGAGGARWTTTLWAFNVASQPVGLTCPDSDPANCAMVLPHSVAGVPAPAGATHPGFFAHAVIRNAQTGLLETVVGIPLLDLRTVDSVTAPHSAGTQIPLVQLDEFSNSTLVFPHIPVNGHSRLKLRLYGVADTDSLVVAWGLEPHAGDTSGTLFTGVPYVSSRQKMTGAVNGQFPSYAEIDLPTNVNVSALLVYVQPLPHETRIWGFVTITDNESQQITVATPTTPLPSD